MEPLFATKVKIDLEECKLLAKVGLRKRRIIWNIMAAISFCMVFYSLCFKAYGQMLFFLFMMALFILTAPILVNVEAKQIYNANREFYDAEQIIEFYPDKMIRKSPIVRTELDYTNIYRINETKTHFYILQSKTSAYCIKKENCSKELCEFIRGLGEK